MTFTRLVAAGVILAAVALSPGLAYAADPPSLTITAGVTHIPEPFPAGRAVRIAVKAHGVTGAKVTIDTSGLPASLGLGPLSGEPGCAMQGKTITCGLPDGTYETKVVLQVFNLPAPAGTEVKGTFTATGTATNVEAASKSTGTIDLATEPVPLPDLAATGSTVTGGVGQTVKARIGVRNVGTVPVDDLISAKTFLTISYFLKVPAGTEVVGIPANCNAVWIGHGRYGEEPAEDHSLGKDLYMCWNNDTDFAPGDSLTAEITLKIKQPLHNVVGAVTLADPRGGRAATPSHANINPANDTAAVTVSSSGPILPATGSNTGLIAGAGALLLTVGAALFLLARRRRVVLVTPEY